MLLDAFLSFLSHHQVLCLVLHACLFERVVHGIFRSNPLETCSRGPLVKNGLIVNKTIVVLLLVL